MAIHLIGAEVLRYQAVTGGRVGLAKHQANVGTQLTLGSAVLKVTAANEVQYVKPVSQTAKASIPNTVTIGGKKFSVTSVAANAFKGDKKLTTLTIGTT